MQEIKNDPQVYTTQEGMEEIKNNPQVYTTQDIFYMIYFLSTQLTVLIWIWEWKVEQFQIIK